MAQLLRIYTIWKYLQYFERKYQKNFKNLQIWTKSGWDPEHV